MLYCDSDSPALDRGVERRLREIDRGLVVTWSKFAIDLEPGPRQGYPIDDLKGRPILGVAPKYYLWSRDEVGAHHLVGAWTSFDGRHIKWLEHNAYDTQNRPLGERLRVNARKADEMRERKLASNEDDRSHWIRENKKRIEDSIEWGKHHRRDGKIFSSGYVKYRGGAGEDMPRSAKEDGWTERPTGK